MYGIGNPVPLRTYVTPDLFKQMYFSLGKVWCEWYSTQHPLYICCIFMVMYTDTFLSGNLEIAVIAYDRNLQCV